MKNEMFAHLSAEEVASKHAEQRIYVVGVVLALILTVAAFALVWLRLLTGMQALMVLGALALIQIVVHMRFFLHIDLAKSHQDDLRLILFTALIIFIIVAGTIWILWDQHVRMMG